MNTHICREHRLEQQLAEKGARRWSIKQEAQVVMSHDLEDERVMHLLEYGLVVVYHRQWCFRIFLLMTSGPGML